MSYVSFVLRALFKNLRVILEAFDGMDLTCLPGLLQRMMALYVASHYKNSPNDLHLMSDAPAHHLFLCFLAVWMRQKTVYQTYCVLVRFA